MKCAQCEEAEATLRCADEDLYFCDQCSVVLHKKKARQHHEVEPISAPLVCDECENALADVKCFQCGGQKTALVFCAPCCASLHSKAARASHQLIVIKSLKKQGREKSIKGKIIIDLTGLDLDKEDQDTIVHKTKNVFGPGVLGKSRVKEEAKDANPSSKVNGKTVKSRDTPDPTARKSRKLSDIDRNSESKEKVGRKATIAGLLKHEDGKKVKEEKPVKREIATRSAIVKRPQNSERESSSESDVNESEDELDGVHRIKRGSVSVEAFLVEADDSEEGPSGAVPEDNVQAGIKKRIRNMLELGLHPDTPEFEAQQALKNAQRLLTKHNLQQAEVLKGALTDTSSLVGGMRVVELRTKGKGKQGRMDTWVQELGWVIADNFDCQYFFKTGSSSKPLRVVFYGISHNADCAGYAFAATYNRISTMASAYVACKSFDDEDKENQDVKPQHINQGIYTRVARTNYRKGVVAGLKEAVRNGQQMRKESASGLEQEKGKEKKSCAEDCSDPDEFASCESDGGVGDDFDYDFDCLSPSDKKPKCEDSFDNDDTGADRKAERCMAINALVLHSAKVGEDFLKQKGIKIRKRTIQKRAAAWNEEAFAQGKTDSATIDINQKSITGTRVKKSRGSAK